MNYDDRQIRRVYAYARKKKNGKFVLYTVVEFWDMAPLAVWPFRARRRIVRVSQKQPNGLGKEYGSVGAALCKVPKEMRKHTAPILNDRIIT